MLMMLMGAHVSGAKLSRVLRERRILGSVKMSLDLLAILAVLAELTLT